ncbi:MAG: AI-2E family transporter [Acidimicrobiales bacterium]
MDDQADAPPAAGGASLASASMPPWLPRAMVMFFGGVVLLLAGEWLLSRLSDLILMLVVSLFLSFALEPAVDWLAKRGWRRGSATGLVLAVLFVGTVLFLGAIGKLVVDQVSEFIDQAPSKAQSIEDWANRTFGTNLSSDRIAEEFNNPDGPIRAFATKLAGNALGFSLSALGVVFQFFTILLFTFYLVADGPRFRRTICSFLRPDRQREVLANWEIAIQKTGGYIYSRMLLGGLSAFFHYLAFVLIGVPYAIALALFVGLVSQFVPVVGTYIAGALPTLIALAVNPVDALWVLGFALVYQQIENYLFAPRISARTMSLHPAVAFGAVIAGGGLFGPVGALLALPAAAVLQAIGSTYGSRHEVVESPMTVDHPRRFWIRRRGAEQESDDAEHGTGPDADPPG